MNRIYQGRVTNVQTLKPGTNGKSPDDWEDLRDWPSALWQHHELFQDAVNYYLVALAALADPEHSTNRLIKDLRARVEAAWGEFPRSVGGDAVSLRRSVGKWLKLSEDPSLDEAFEAVLAGNDASPKVRTLALALLLDRCGGESAIQQGGRTYLPRFCDAKTKPTYDFSNVALLADMGRKRLAQTLHGEANEADLAALAAEMELSWTVKLQPGKSYTAEESATRLLEALQHVCQFVSKAETVRVKEVKDQFPDFECALNSFMEKVKNDSREITIPRNRKASKDLTFATLAFKYFPCRLTGKVLSLFLKKPKAVSTEESEARVDFAGCGDDPIKLARGERGFVFRAFTALPDWNPRSPGEPVWKEFDTAAFKEALKSLNQFNKKTQERWDNEDNLRGQLAILLGSEIEDWKPRKMETGEDEPKPEAMDFGLFQLARDLERNLTEDLADTLVGEEQSVRFGEAVFRFREGEWQVSSAALRGYRDISEEWNKLHAKVGENLTTDQLQEVVKRFQRDEKNKKSVGSIPLFLRLCEKKYWPLWLADHEDPEEPGSEKPFLYAMASFHTKFRDFQRSREPINLTPAEPKHSRRLYMFSDVKDKLAKVTFGQTEDGFALECAIARRMGTEGIKEHRVRLHYSAKRLLRDELQGGVESRWLQPMTHALELQMPEVEAGKAFESAVSLMPDFPRSGNGSDPADWRFLLNFPVTLDPAWIHSGIGAAARWKGQFNGTRDKNLHLHWPGTIKGKGSESPWWKNGRIIDQGFTCVSVDLGQRTAGAWALLRVTSSDPREGNPGTKRPVRQIGCDGERTWIAEVFNTGILRLPGEDQKVTNAKRSLEVERFGKAGRNALESEWEEGKNLARALLAKTPEAWVGASFSEKSFSEQNDALIALANRRLSRLNTFHRWSCFNPDRPEVEARRADLIARLVEELSHWQDAEVTTWKELVEKGDFEGFRAAAGAGFDTLRQQVGAHLEALANRVAPLRDRSWKWNRSRGKSEQGIYGVLIDSGPQLGSEPTWIRGQRGLSFSRIEQLENLRRLFLRYNRSFDREPGTPTKFGRADFGRRSGEPCQLLLEKIDHLKEQRVNQTAHLILAQALGLRLRAHQIEANERETRDIHGEYERIPGREPVDFIVIENLDRYLTSQGRGPSENSRLMKWTHRTVRDKIKMLAEEPFGIPVVEASAAYSSRFCAVTGVAGARCEERAELDDPLRESLANRAKRPAKPGQPKPADWTALLTQFDQLKSLNAESQGARKEAGKKNKSPHTLFFPRQGGPLFLALEQNAQERQFSHKIPKQADINAAINIGLRAVAAPDALGILHKVRTERDGEGFRPATKNSREKAAFKLKPLIKLHGNACDKLAKARSPNFFFDAKAFDCFDTASVEVADQIIPLVSGIGLWATVNQHFVRRLITLNQHRLDRWRGESVT